MVSGQVTVTLPAELTAEMIRAVRDHPTTAVEDRDEWHKRLGWLISAWDVLLQHRVAPLPPECPTYPTSSGDHVICRICGETWAAGRDSACVRAAKQMRAAADRAS